MTIKKVKGGYKVFSKSTGKPLSKEPKTYNEAIRQEYAIMKSKEARRKKRRMKKNPAWSFSDHYDPFDYRVWLGPEGEIIEIANGAGNHHTKVALELIEEMYPEKQWSEATAYRKMREDGWIRIMGTQSDLFDLDRDAIILLADWIEDNIPRYTEWHYHIYDVKNNVSYAGMPWSSLENRRLRDVKTHMVKMNPGEIELFNDHVDSYRDEQYYTLIATRNGDYVGSIDYSTYGREVSITLIRVEEGERRKGIGTAMLKELERLWPDHYIEAGPVTKIGYEFFKSAGYHIDPHNILKGTVD
jgi:GNAT superfamily N-acetyltransferase